VIVTGGGTGIGAETARSFAAAGASRIALLGRRVKPLLYIKAAIERDFPSAEVFIASTDITKKSEVDVAFEEFLGERKVDVLVSNAGSMEPSESVEDENEHTFTEFIETSIQGSFFVAQAFLRHAAANAVAINLSSSAAHWNFGLNFAACSIAKIAVVRLWDSLGFAHPELSVFHIQPGV
jgi:NAD(P)-dependent dehydrogenase (short-subunit alcohol dehydrogenase family)